MSCVRPRSPLYMGVRGLLFARRVSHLAGYVVCFAVLCTDFGVRVTSNTGCYAMDLWCHV